MRFEKFTKNRRGDIPIVILVIGVFAICGIAILSFYLSDMNFRGDFSGVALIEKINSIENEIKFYEQIGKNPTEIIDIFDKELSLKNQFIFHGEKNNGYVLEGTLVDGSRRVLFVKYNFG